MTIISQIPFQYLNWVNNSFCQINLTSYFATPVIAKGSSHVFSWVLEFNSFLLASYWEILFFNFLFFYSGLILRVLSLLELFFSVWNRELLSLLRASFFLVTLGFGSQSVGCEATHDRLIYNSNLISCLIDYLITVGHKPRN